MRRTDITVGQRVFSTEHTGGKVLIAEAGVVFVEIGEDQAVRRYEWSEERSRYIRDYYSASKLTFGHDELSLLDD